MKLLQVMISLNHKLKLFRLYLYNSVWGLIVAAPLRCIAYKQSRGLSFRAKGLDVPGMKLDNVKMLETPEDARQIHALSLGSNVVLVGTSFVGMLWCIRFYICLDWSC